MPVNLLALAAKQKVESVRKHLEEMASLEAVLQNVKLLPLTQGVVALIDFQDWKSVAGFSWYAGWNSSSEKFYPMRGDYRDGWKSRRTMFLHNFILGFPDLFVDHINGNSLDNRRENLRLCTMQQNIFNRSGFIKTSSTPSRFKGVCWHKRIGKWQSHICLNKTKIHLGYFHSETEAAIAYNKKALELFGEFSNLNPIGEQRCAKVTGPMG